MKKLTPIDKSANTTGLVLGILFFVVIFIGTFNPLGIRLDTKAYVESAVAILFPVGLFIGLKWKGLGILVCFLSMVASVFIYLYDRTIVNYTFIIVLFLIQMLPLILYIISWYNHRKMKIN